MSTKKVMFSEDVILRLSQALEHVGVKEYGRNKKIAEMTGFNDTHISGIFNKKVTLTAKFIKGVCKEFLISEDFVLYGTGEIKVAPHLNDGRTLDGSWPLGVDRPETIPPELADIMDKFKALDPMTRLVVEKCLDKVRGKDQAGQWRAVAKMLESINEEKGD